MQYYNFFLGFVRQIDVCPTNGNLLAAGGRCSKSVMIYDRRESKIVKTLGSIHSGNNRISSK